MTAPRREPLRPSCRAPRPHSALARSVRVALGLALALPTAPAPQPGKGKPHVELTLPTATARGREAPWVHPVAVLADRELGDLLRNGFPARLHYRVELWSTGGWVNDLEAQTQWDVVVRYDPVNRTYHVGRVVGGRFEPLGVFDDYADVQAVVERPFRVPIAPPAGHTRYYYNAVLDVETLSLSDLDEVERWLRGELRPAVRGQKNPGTALTRGIRRLFVRLLGGRARHYEARSDSFEPE